MVGFPALVDRGHECRDRGLRRARGRRGAATAPACAGWWPWQLKEPLKYLEKNMPGLTEDGLRLYMPLGTLEELRAQVIDLALERAFLVEPLAHRCRAAFKTRLDEGRARLNLIAQEVARQATAVLVLIGHAAATRKLKDSAPDRKR